MTRIGCLRDSLTAADAERIVAESAGETARTERAIYYPYLWYRFRYTLETLFGDPRILADCLVDARQGLASTADPVEVSARDVREDEILEPAIGTDESVAVARETMRHVLSKKHRRLSRIDLDMDEAQTIYRKFWVVRCKLSGTRALVDASSGNFTALEQ